MTKPANDGRVLPLVCTLAEPELRRRTNEIRQGLARRVTATREMEDGIAFRLAFTDQSLAEAEAFIAFERRCCEFADFTLRRDELDEALWVEIRGPAGTKTFFQQLMPLHAADSPDESRRDPKDRLLSAGIFAAVGAAVALVCCATPVLAFALGLLGVAGATASVSLWIDSVAVPVMVASGAVVVFAWIWRRLRLRSQSKGSA